MKKWQKTFYASFILSILLLLASDGFTYQKKVSELASFVNTNMDKIASRKRIVVVDFIYDKDVSGKLGQFLADELSSDISKKANNYEVLNRSQLKSSISESDFVLKHPYDQKEIKDLGSKAKVGGIVSGTISVFKSYIRLSVNLISTYSGKVVATKKVDIPLNEKIKDLLREDFEKGGEKTSFLGEFLDIIEHNGIRFELKQCKQLDIATMCSFTITSKKSEPWRFYLSNTSSLYDENGVNYMVQEMSFGGRTGHNNYYVYSDLVPNVSENGVIYFIKVPDTVRTVDFTIALHDESNQVYKAVFKRTELKR